MRYAKSEKIYTGNLFIYSKTDEAIMVAMNSTTCYTVVAVVQEHFHSMIIITTKSSPDNQMYGVCKVLTNQDASFGNANLHSDLHLVESGLESRYKLH